MKFLNALTIFLLTLSLARAADVSEHVGFHRGRLRYSLEVDIEESSHHEATTCLLKKGTSFELVNELVQTRVLLDDGSLTKVPNEAIEKSKSCWSVPRTTLFKMAKKLSSLPKRKVARGIDYQSASEHGSKLHLLTIRLSGTNLEPAVVLSPRFSKASKSNQLWLDLNQVAREHNALITLSGTFYACCKKYGGRPLGRVVTDGQVINPPKKFIRARRRASYIWTTTGHHQVVNSQVSIEKQKDTKVELGGMGILVQNGNVNAWRDYVGKHFEPSYYSGFTRRPQVLYGTDSTGKILWILLQEGRPRSPRPLSLPELAVLLAACGARSVAFSDGGTTADLLINGQSMVARGHGCRRELHSTAWVIRPIKEVVDNAHCED